jgi:NAD(P)-dependent dehydrogenase (short-subunit alcohol dehydrogenase family)
MTASYPFAVFGDEFKGKRVLVTGGTKGMGEAIVRRFQLSGAFVATTARSPSPQTQTFRLVCEGGHRNGFRHARGSQSHSAEVGRA